MFFKRDLTETLKRFSKFPVIALLGPRQSGKTTLAKNLFKNHIYLNFENPEIRDFATRDPNRFLKENENEYGIILDEFQHVPQILSYIQIEADERKKPGYFILTGSQNFLMNQSITQSLAGRVGILTLLPLSLNELKENKLLESTDETIFNGGYPRIFSEKFLPTDLYPSYIHSYIERDIRQLINVENLGTFQKFIKLCAGRVGQLLNITELAANCGINWRTATQWLSILESSYIIFLLKPHFTNFNKRITKTPKLYFYDTGLACSFLEIKSTKELALSHFRGHLFENLIISDLFKQYYNIGQQPPIYFWRDQNGILEIDCIIDQGLKLVPIEVKSSETIVNDFFKNFSNWNEMANSKPADNYIIYGGDLNQGRTIANVVSWKDSGKLISKIETQKI